MSNYTKTTNFGAKDTLPSGDSQKIVRGTEFDTEFNAISTAIATKLESGSSSADVNFLQSGTGATARTVQSKLRDVVSVKDFGAVGDGVTDDTAAIQAAINSLTGGGCVEFPSGTYLTTGVTLPASPRISLSGTDNVWLKAAPTATTVLKLLGDISRSGNRSVTGINIDGNSVASVIGFSSGTATSAALYVDVKDMQVKRCSVGIDLYSAMEHTLINVTAYLNTVGMKLRQDVTNGGANANAFYRCAVQSNTIGLILDAASPYPMQNNTFSNLIVQSNTLCGVAAFGVENGVTFDGCHFENNATSGTTLVVDSNTIYKCSMQLNASSILMANSGNGEATANPAVKMFNASNLSLNNVSGYGVTEGVFCEKSDSTKSYVSFAGECVLYGVAGYVMNWSGIVTKTSSGARYGAPIFSLSDYPNNTYAGSGLIAWTPEAQNAVTAVPAKAWDADMGYVQNVQYAASVGSTGTNRVTFASTPSAVAIGDKILVSFFVKASVSTTLTFYMVGSTQLMGPKLIQLGTDWRRVVLWGTAVNASAAGYLVYAYPTNTDGANVSFARMMCVQVQSGNDSSLLDQTMQYGLFNPNQNTLYGPAAPTTGTWAKGDRIVNTSPTVGQPKAWSCTVAGTPGTWVSEGNL